MELKNKTKPKKHLCFLLLSTLREGTTKPPRFPGERPPRCGRGPPWGGRKHPRRLPAFPGRCLPQAGSGSSPTDLPRPGPLRRATIRAPRAAPLPPPRRFIPPRCTHPPPSRTCRSPCPVPWGWWFSALPRYRHLRRGGLGGELGDRSAPLPPAAERGRPGPPAACGSPGGGRRSPGRSSWREDHRRSGRIWRNS